MIPEIRAALSFISAHDRELWVKMAMAVKSELGDDGFSLWDEWSSQADNYKACAAKSVWRSIKPDGKVSLGSLFYEARKQGWHPESKPRPTEPRKETQKSQVSLEDRHAKAVARAASIWRRAKPVELHPYLSEKRVRAFGVRVGQWEKRYQGHDGKWRTAVISNCLLIPARDTSGQLRTLQAIAEGLRPYTGSNKDFLHGGAIAGHYHAIGRHQGTLCIVEGYATAATIHQATGHAVAVAFNAGNLKAVALALRAKFPEARVIVCADNDRFTPGNPGVTKAREAALAVGGQLYVPRFDDSGPYDFYREGNHE